MPIIWRGLGILIPVIYILAAIAVSFIIRTFDLNINPDITNLKFIAAVVLTGGLLNWYFGTKINAPAAGPNGEELKNRHHLFFIPVQYWSFIIGAVGLMLGSGVSKRFAYVEETYTKGRAEFMETREKLLEYLKNPQAGDYYYFHFDIPMGDMGRKEDRMWRNGGTLLYKVVHTEDARVEFAEPAAAYGTLNVLREKEDYAPYFPPDSIARSRVFWVKKALLEKAVSQNFQKSRTFPGCTISAFNKGNMNVRLFEIKRF